MTRRGFSNFQGFREQGIPLLHDWGDRIVLNTLYPRPLRGRAFVIDVIGSSSLFGNLAINGTLTGATTAAFTGSITMSANQNLTLFASSDAFIAQNVGVATAIAPMNKAGRFRFTNPVWDLAGANSIQNWAFDVKGIVANPAQSRLQFGYMLGASTAEGYAERMSIDNSGTLTILGSTFGAESLTNSALTAGTSWTVTGGMALTANAATYTHAAGTGSLSQAAVTLATPGVANRWYKFTYTASALTAGSSIQAFIDTTFATQREYLSLVAGTFTNYFQANAAPGAFTIQLVSTVGAVTLDTFSLTECQSGDIEPMGNVIATRGYVKTQVTTVANLPAPATAGIGARLMVSDALTPAFGAAVVAGGAVVTPVFSTGAAWNVG